MMTQPTAAERWLIEIEHGVHMDLNPNDEDCPVCGGEGFTHDCFDGFCEDAEIGCDDCSRRCEECKIYERKVRAAVQVEVLRALDIDLAIAFLKAQDRWSDKITRERVLANLHAGRCACKEFTSEERAAAACWVEGLL